MAWNHQTQGPVSFDQNSFHQFYAPQQQQDEQGVDLGYGTGNGHGNGLGRGSGDGMMENGNMHAGGNAGQASHSLPAAHGSLGFYPNPSHVLPNNISYFNPDYSIGQHGHTQPHLQPQAPEQPQNQAYRPSPLGNGMDPTYPDFNLASSNTYDGMLHSHSISHEDLSALNFPEQTVPPPRYSETQYHHQHQANAYLPQQQFDYPQSGVNANLSGNGNGNRHQDTMPTLDTTYTDAFNELLANPNAYSSFDLPPLHESSAQGTISPSQLAPPGLTKQFSGLFMSRGSSSSASSTEGGHDWATTPNMLDGDGQTVPSNLSFSTNMASFNVPPPLAMPNNFGTVANGGHLNQVTESNQAVRAYLLAANRLAYGERRLVISTPKVGQKSYGNEKRFLCPHPQATLYGSAWWTTQGEGCPAPTILPPRVNISLSGEDTVKDASVSWSTVGGKNLDDKINVEPILKDEKPFVGNVAGRSLHISDSDGKRSNFNARVRIRAPAPSAEPGSSSNTGGTNGQFRTGKPNYLETEASEIIGSFDSKDIKIISKPSKKKTNTKSSELVITHGSTIALYNRTKSQTASTRYLNIESDLTNIRGSDGQPVTGARARTPTMDQKQKPFAGLTSSASVWESFIIWLADPSKPPGPSGLPPAQPGWPSQPMNAMVTGQVLPPIRYNALVVLQSLQSGQCTPPLIIRRIDQDADAVGQDGTWGDMSCGHAPDGEMLGDMVAQVQKIALELYDPILSGQLVHNRAAGDSRWLAYDHDAVLARYVRTERRWSPIPIPYRGVKSHSTPTTPIRGFHILPMTPHTSSTNLPSTPSSPVSSGSSLDYFGAHSRKASSTNLMSPISSNGEPLPHISTDGGPLRRQRTGSTGRAGPLGRPAHKKRQSQDSHSASSSYDHLPNALGNILEQRQSWALNVGDVAVWTIVGTEQVSYTFYVPPSVSVSDNPIAPFPTVTKYLPPGAEKTDKRTDSGFTPQTDLPLVHLYGKGFNKISNEGPKYDVYYGDQKARHVESRCEECMAAAEPVPGTILPAPITLVRKDGRCIIPTGLMYEHPPYQSTLLHQQHQQHQHQHQSQHLHPHQNLQHHSHPQPHPHSGHLMTSYK